MNQKELNDARIDDWESDEKYEQKFRLPLTAKHQLVVGRWEVDGEWGIDLRRWSYDQARLLGAGISLKEKTWKQLFTAVLSLHEDGLFAHFSQADESDYSRLIKVEAGYELHTGQWSEGPKPYFTINLHHNGRPLWRGPHAPVGILIRFDTMGDFVEKVQEEGLSPRRSAERRDAAIDPKTGKQIF